MNEAASKSLGTFCKSSCPIAATKDVKIAALKERFRELKNLLECEEGFAIYQIEEIIEEALKE